MNLAPCPSCGHYVSLEAISCPKCGKPFSPGELAAHQVAHQENVKSGKRGCLWVVLVIVALLLLCGLLRKDDPEEDMRREREEMLRDAGFPQKK